MNNSAKSEFSQELDLKKLESAQIRAFLSHNDPALLRLLDQCRNVFRGRLVRYWCPLIIISYTNRYGRHEKAAWRGSRFSHFVNPKQPWRNFNES